MKVTTIILSLIILALSTIPCSDGENSEDQYQDTISANHNHQNDTDDSCPMTCICNCCGMAITYEPLADYNFNLRIKISTELVSTYQTNYRFDYRSNIWQPPQLIG
jgi:hypothetical protein